MGAVNTKSLITVGMLMLLSACAPPVGPLRSRQGDLTVEYLGRIPLDGYGVNVFRHEGRTCYSSYSGGTWCSER